MPCIRGVSCVALAAVVVAGCRSGPSAEVKRATPTAEAPRAATPTATATATAPKPSVTNAPAAPPDDIQFDNSGAPKPLVVLGMTRPIGQQAALFSATELNAYLSNALGGDVQTKLYESAAALGDALSAGQIDAAWLTPVAYVRASERAAVRPLARLSRGGFTSYRSVLFVRADAKAKSLDDVKGLRMGWVQKGSASGRDFPRAYLSRKGIDPQKFFSQNVDFTDHAAVCRAVLDGDVDVGATFSDERPAGESALVDGCREGGLDPAKFRIVQPFSAVPNDVIAARADLSTTIEDKLRDALLSMASTDAGKRQLHDIFRADGFSGVTDSDFAPVREVKQQLEMK